MFRRPQDALRSNPLLVWGENTSSFLVDGLTTGVLYFFNVLVRDLAGNVTAYVPVSKTVITVDNDGDGVSPPLDPDDSNPCNPNTGGDVDTDLTDYCSDPDDLDECVPNNDKDGDGELCGTDPNDWDQCVPNQGSDDDLDGYYSCDDPDDSDFCNPSSGPDLDADSVPQCFDPNDTDCRTPNPLWVGDGDGDGAPCGTDADDMDFFIQ